MPVIPGTKRAARPWSITPVPAGLRDDLAILREIRDEALALTLWRALRDVRLWVATPPELREELARPVPGRVRGRMSLALGFLMDSGDVAPAVIRSVGVLGALLLPGARATPEAVGTACAELAEWVETGPACRETAALFAEAAASLNPADAERATRAARLNRLAGDTARAHGWYERAITLARRARDSEQYIQACLGSAEIETERGNRGVAHRLYARAFRRADSTGRRSLAAGAQQQIIALIPRSAPAEQWVVPVRRALRNYPLHHPRVPQLAYDVAVGMLESRHYRAAAVLLRSILSRVEGPLRRLAEAAYVRAAIGAGWRADGPDGLITRAQALDLPADIRADVLAHLAEAHRALHAWGAADDSAGAALQAAIERDDRATAREARVLLAHIRARAPAPPEIPLPADGRLSLVLRDLDFRLERWRGGTPSAQPVRPYSVAAC